MIDLDDELNGKNPALLELFARRLLLDDFEVEFKKLYPNSWVVRPDAITASEMRYDFSRFHPSFENEGFHVIEGSFH